MTYFTGDLGKGTFIEQKMTVRKANFAVILSWLMAVCFLIYFFGVMLSERVDALTLLALAVSIGVCLYFVPLYVKKTGDLTTTCIVYFTIWILANVGVAHFSPAQVPGL